MDFGNFSDNLPVIISVVVLLVLQFIMRKKRSPNADNVSMVQNISAEIGVNLRMVESFNYSKPGRGFMTTSWKLYESKLDFLSNELQKTLSNTFMLAEEYNQQIKSARKTKSTSYLSGIDIDRFQEMLLKTQKGLEEWLSTRSQDELTPKMPGMLDGLIGKH